MTPSRIQPLAVLAALALASCTQQTETDKQVESAQDVTIYTGGPIYTGNDDAPTVEAVAVSGGTVVAVGTRALIEKSAGDNYEIVDLAGAAMYPGFTDAHAHLLGIGMRELTLNLEGVTSVAELVEVVRTEVEKTPAGETIYGRGWIETHWPEGRFPRRSDLDPVSPNNPVILRRADGHASIVNSYALNKAGITAHTQITGGEVRTHENGETTGLLIDNAQSLVADLIAAPSLSRKEEAYRKASDVYAAYGWTGIHSMSVDAANVEIMERLADERGLNIRVYNSIDKDGLDWLIENAPRTNASERIITRALKLYVDGALGSRGAALTSPYSDSPDSTGLLLMEEPEALEIMRQALAADIQVNTHAIGDRGNRLVLDWYENVFDGEEADRRWRIEHAQILHLNDIPRFAELGVIASMQPSHAIGDLFFAPDRLGPDRLDGAYAWRSLIDAGAIIAAGSDAPVERGDPLIEFYAAVARRGLNGYQDDNWRAAEAVTRAEALKMFTLWPAYASFQENILGMIEPGKRADFTVFTADIMTIAEDEILEAKPVMTVVDGAIIFDARN